MSIASIPFVPVESEYPAAPPVSPSNEHARIYLEMSHRGPHVKRKSCFLSFEIHGTDDSTSYIADAIQRLSETFCGRCSAHREACQCADGPVAPVECL